MKATHTITSLLPDRTTQSEKYGPTVWIAGMFEDGSKWSLPAKPENAAERRTELMALIGKPGEFEVEDGGLYQETQQWKLRSWPGKPQKQGGFGGKREFVPRYRDTAEGFAQEQQSIHRSVALQYAVGFLNGDTSRGHDWQPVADRMYDWLSGRSGAESNGGQPAEAVRVGKGSLAPGGAAAPPTAISEETKLRLTELLFQKIGHVPKQTEALAYLGKLSTGVLGATKVYGAVAQIPESEALAYVRHLEGELATR